MTSYRDLIHTSLQEGLDLRQRMWELSDSIERCGQTLIDCLASGGRLFFAGNGGSAADCQHLATELVGRFEVDNQLNAMALTTDTSLLTAVGNDFGFDQVFVRQVRALGRKGDCLICISTSGNSANLLVAVDAALAMGITCVALTGGTGGKLSQICSPAVVVPSPRTCRIQEIHITVGHIWCEMIEEARRRGQLP